MSTDNNASQLVEEARKRAAESINSAHADLVLNHPNRQIPEEIFRVHFLDFFTTQEKLDPNRNYLAEWIGVAGTSVSKVDAIDPAGNVLFTVPPVMDSSIMNLSNPGGKSLKDMMYEYKLHAEGLPGAADRYAKQVFGDKAAQLTPGHSDETVASNAWSKILDYYHITPLDKSGQALIKTQTTGDDLEYD